MENSLYIALSKQRTLGQSMNMIANNVANINTPGYKAQRIMFNEYVQDKVQGIQEPISMVMDGDQYMESAQGSLRYTGNNTDVAIQGDGFFSVTGPGNQEMYTRAGNFAINVEGELVTQEGFPVLGDGGTITIPEGTKDILVAEDGTITGDEGAIGKLKISEFDDVQALAAHGYGLYKTDQAPKEAENSRVVHGAVEKSNVAGVREITDMIEVSRSYQSIQRTIQTEHDRIREMIKALTQGQ